jgi:SAM-dependent methyltransferase
VTGFFTRLRRQETDAAGSAPAPPVQAQATRGLARFLAGLSAREQPTLLDLGPVVGANVTFFGGELGCKIFVEDLTKDVERHARENVSHDFPAFLERRFPQPSDSFDGVLCWDVFDFLDRAAKEALAAQVIRLLRPDGVALAFFNHTEAAAGPTSYTRHIVLDQRTLEHRRYPASALRQRPFLNRDIQRVFTPLAITDQFLLKTNMREVVFRKPGNGANSGAECGVRAECT